MQGSYRIYIDGEKVAEQANLITTAGKLAIADYMAGILPVWAGSLAVGAGDTVVSESDQRLDFEISRSSVKSKSVEYGTPNVITVKATLDNDVSGYFTELGVFSGDANSGVGTNGSTMISVCDSSEQWEKNTGSWVPNPDPYDITYFRNGADSVTMTATTSATYRLNGIDLDLSSFAANDVFLFATRLVTGSLTSVRVRFYTDASNYFSYTSTAFASSIYAGINIQKSDFVATGTPSWSSIAYIEFLVTGNCALILDGIRIEESVSASTEYVLVSRTLLSVPISKSPGSLMEIEYRLEI